MLKSMSVRLSALVFACMVSATALALADTPKPVNVPSGDLVPALESLARQCGVDVIYPSAQLKGFHTNGVSGTLEPKEAFRKLIEGTPLILKEQGDAVLISLPAPASTSSSSSRSDTAAQDQQKEGKSNSSGAFLMAQTTPGQNQGAASVGQTGGQPGEEKKKEHLEEIVVVGTHIRGVENPTSPITILDRSYIDSSGYTTTARLMDSLPQNFSLTNEAGINTPGVTSTVEQGASINLRGIGEGTTLILLNGRRMAPGFIGTAADISALPLSAIERVEILTDGASALYGSDAVGGVVNFVLRRDYEGQETHAEGGFTSEGGASEYRLSHTAGHAWDTGNAVISLEYYHQDLLPATDRAFVPNTSQLGSLLPQDKDLSALFSGRQQLTDTLAGFSDVLYTRRDSFNRGGLTTLDESKSVQNPQLWMTLGVDSRLGGDWQVEITGGYADNDMTRNYDTVTGNEYWNIKYPIFSADAKMDGTLAQIPGGNLRAAVGVDWRHERLDYSASGTSLASLDISQSVRSAYGELSVPLVGSSNAVAGVRRLELSAAGRVDDYSSFGSSVDPQAGLMWEPVSGLRLRGSYGTSYKAPTLIDYAFFNNQAVAFTGPDPASTTGVSSILQVGGATADYTAQRSKNFSAGFELTPAQDPGLKITGNYYNIRYRDQIAAPPADYLVLLNNPSSYSQLIIRNPSVPEVNQYIAIGNLGMPFLAFNPDFTINTNFNPASINVIVDLRTRNLSIVNTRGVDFGLQQAFKFDHGSVDLGLNGTYMLERQQQTTAASAPFDSVSTIYNPPKLRFRASAGWRYWAWSTNLFVNYVGHYDDNRLVPQVPVSSWTTLDAQIAYEFGAGARTAMLSGLALSISVQNLLNKDPPQTAVLSPYDPGFDSTNANPLGRFIAAQLAKKW